MPTSPRPPRIVALAAHVTFPDMVARIPPAGWPAAANSDSPRHEHESCP